MAYKTTLNGSAQVVPQRLASIGHDVLTIAELQARLFVVDLRYVRRGILHGLALGLASCLLAIAALPTALIRRRLLACRLRPTFCGCRASLGRICHHDVHWRPWDRRLEPNKTATLRLSADPKRAPDNPR